MRDQLEKFISENREAFDDQVPDLKVWAEIDKELSEDAEPPAKIRPLRRFLSFVTKATMIFRQ